MTIKEKIMKIMSLSLEINPPEVKNIGMKKTAVFVRWSPHASVLGIDIYYSGWKEILPDKEYVVYTSWENAHEELDEVIEMLEKIKEGLIGGKVNG